MPSAHTFTHMCTCTHTHAHTHARMYTHICKHTDAHTCAHTCAHTHMYVCTHIYAHASTQMHTPVHTHMHTHTCSPQPCHRVPPCLSFPTSPATTPAALGPPLAPRTAPVGPGTRGDTDPCPSPAAPAGSPRSGGSGRREPSLRSRADPPHPAPNLRSWLLVPDKCREIWAGIRRNSGNNLSGIIPPAAPLSFHSAFYSFSHSPTPGCPAAGPPQGQHPALGAAGTRLRGEDGVDLGGCCTIPSLPSSSHSESCWARQGPPASAGRQQAAAN